LATANMFSLGCQAPYDILEDMSIFDC